MVARVIIGANYGDEGKGTVVAHYTKHAEGSVLNVLTNGGPQRAHSILTEAGSFTFQHFGSGTYHGADNYFSKYFIINPFVFVDEFKRLTDKGIRIKNVYRDPGCRWTTPWDMMANQIKEELRGYSKHGSCGMGIWETVLRYRTTTTVTFDEFMQFDHDRRENYLEGIIQYHARSLDFSDGWRRLFFSDSLVDNFISDCEILKAVTTTATLSDCSGYSELIFENGQGLLLTDTGIDIPGTTPSKTGSECFRALAEGMSIDNITTHYVTRPYLTRHGFELLNECRNDALSESVHEDRTNHFNQFQGKFRYAPLDIESLRNRICADNGVNPVIELTHCDEMDRLDEFRKSFDSVNVFDNALIK